MIKTRRFVLAGLAFAAASPALAHEGKKLTGEALTPPLTLDLAQVKTAAQYYMGVISPAELSLATSQIGIEKAAHKSAHEFAGFELGEAITVNMVLKDIGTVAPAMSDTAMAAFEAMKAAPKGAAFDRAYIGFQLENHQNLRDLADAYLHNSVGATDTAEKQGRHLASLMLAVFKEHVAICKRIVGELEA